MDGIMALKKQHIKITDSQFESLQKQIQLLDRIKNEQNQQCSEDEMKIEELTSKVTSMKQSLQAEKQALECKNHDLSKHLDSVLELEAERNKLLQENQSLESKRNRLKSCKPNSQDQNLLEQGRRKFTFYKELTRIRWDYENLKESVEGNVSNKRDYIHHFRYKNEDANLTDHLWQEIYQSTIDMNNEDVYTKEKKSTKSII